MIADTKTQNTIIVVTLILGIVSGLGLVTSSSHFTGSLMLVNNLEFYLLEVRITGLDPTNESINPRITLMFNVKAPTGYDGDASLLFLRASVELNEEPFIYTQTQWRKNIPEADQQLYSGYDKNFTMGETLSVLVDKQILYDAEASDAWAFTINLHATYRIFDARVSFRNIAFTHDGHT